MKTQMLLNAALAAFAITASTVSAQAADFAPFARVEATYTDTGYDDALFQPEGFEPGLGLTLGAHFGTQAQHEISLSTGFTKWEGRHSVLAGVADVNDEVEQIPLLLNYRYRYALTDKLTLSAGPTAGFIREEVTTNVNLNAGIFNLKPVGSYSDTDWKTAFGGTLGADYRLTDSWTLSASVQALRVDSSDYDTASTDGTRPYDAATRIGITLGATYSW